MNHWLAFDASGVRAFNPDTGTLEDMAFIREQVALKRSTRLDESGTIPEIIKEKEVNMTAGDFPEQGQLPPKSQQNAKIENLLPPLPAKRTRRKKGVAPGIEIITTKTAVISLHIPERPEGMEKVVIKVFTAKGAYIAEWYEGEHEINILGNLKKVADTNA